MKTVKTEKTKRVGYRAFRKLNDTQISNVRNLIQEYDQYGNNISNNFTSTYQVEENRKIYGLTEQGAKRLTEIVDGGDNGLRAALLDAAKWLRARLDTALAEQARGGGHAIRHVVATKPGRTVNFN